MMLFPPAPGTCPACAVKHRPDEAHNALSMYYQYRFYGLRGRWPTWADAVAHCAPEVQARWRFALEEMGEAWTEPAGDPIADPPEETISQALGDVNAPGFEPEEV